MKYLAVVFATLAAAATPSAQQPAGITQAVAPSPSPQTTVFRTGASLVALNVTVTDGKQFVAGLASDDFAVYEDGVRQEVRFFEATNVPLDLILLIDTSSSMRDKMTIVQEAARGFMKTLRPQDRGAVIEFNDTVTVGQALTSDRGAIEAAINRSEARGGTALNNALYIAIKEFGRAPADAEVRRQAIAVLSDGQDTTSLLSFEDVLGQARRSGVNIYTIALKSSYQASRPDGRKYFSESDYAMKELAKETGAQAFFPEKIIELKNIYAAIAQELSSQYSIGYAPTNTRSDGRFRRIVVRITSRPELKPRARSGYQSGSSATAPSIDDGWPR